MSPSIFRSSLKLFRKDHGAQNPENSKRKKDGGQHDGATALSTVMTTPSKSVRERSLSHQFQHVQISGSARAHLGDTYNTYNISKLLVEKGVKYYEELIPCRSRKPA
jgi:hypothetical protein